MPVMQWARLVRDRYFELPRMASSDVRATMAFPLWETSVENGLSSMHIARVIRIPQILLADKKKGFWLSQRGGYLLRILQGEEASPLPRWVRRHRSSLLRTVLSLNIVSKILHGHEPNNTRPRSVARGNTLNCSRPAAIVHDKSWTFEWRGLGPIGD